MTPDVTAKKWSRGESNPSIIAADDSETEHNAHGRTQDTRQDRGLREICRAWPNLAHHERSALLTIVRASERVRSGDEARSEPDRPRDPFGRSHAREGVKSEFGGVAGADQRTAPDSTHAAAGGHAAAVAANEGGAA